MDAGVQVRPRAQAQHRRAAEHDRRQQHDRRVEPEHRGDGRREREDERQQPARPPVGAARQQPAGGREQALALAQVPEHEHGGEEAERRGEGADLVADAHVRALT